MSLAPHFSHLPKVHFGFVQTVPTAMPVSEPTGTIASSQSSLTPALSVNNAGLENLKNSSSGSLSATITPDSVTLSKSTVAPSLKSELNEPNATKQTEKPIQQKAAGLGMLRFTKIVGDTVAASIGNKLVMEVPFKASIPWFVGMNTMEVLLTQEIVNARHNWSKKVLAFANRLPGGHPEKSVDDLSPQERRAPMVYVIAGITSFVTFMTGAMKLRGVEMFKRSAEAAKKMKSKKPWFQSLKNGLSWVGETLRVKKPIYAVLNFFKGLNRIFMKNPKTYLLGMATLGMCEGTLVGLGAIYGDKLIHPFSENSLKKVPKDQILEA